jgi:PKHD-type hydroxylase
MGTENRHIADVTTVTAFTAGRCQEVINECDPDAWKISTRQVATSGDMLAGGTERFVDLSHKSRHEQPLRDQSFAKLIRASVESVNQAVYGFRCDSWEQPFRVLRYTAPDDHFIEHVDLGAIHPRRKLAFSMLLSEDFDGGDLAFYGGAVTRTPGVLCVWPSYLRHKVTRVQRGERYVVVGWALGPSFV